MAVVRVVERPRDLVVDVAAVRNGGVAAPVTVAVSAFDRSADAGPDAVDLEAVLVGVGLVRRMKVAVVQVVGMVAVADRPVAAAGAVHVVVSVVLATGHPDRLARRGGVNLSESSGCL